MKYNRYLQLFTLPTYSPNMNPDSSNIESLQLKFDSPLGKDSGKTSTPGGQNSSNAAKVAQSPGTTAMTNEQTLILLGLDGTKPISSFHGRELAVTLQRTQEKDTTNQGNPAITIYRTFNLA